jgi:hypothetical protein
MALSLTAYVLVLAASAFGTAREAAAAVREPVTNPQGALVLHQTAWTAPVAVAVLVLGMYGATLAAFWILRSLPLVASAAGGH